MGILDLAVPKLNLTSGTRKRQVLEMCEK
jgi:hypothetical protein